MLSRYTYLATKAITNKMFLAKRESHHRRIDSQTQKHRTHVDKRQLVLMIFPCKNVRTITSSFSLSHSLYHCLMLSNTKFFLIFLLLLTVVFSHSLALFFRVMVSKSRNPKVLDSNLRRKSPNFELGSVFFWRPK